MLRHVFSKEKKGWGEKNVFLNFCCVLRFFASLCIKGLVGIWGWFARGSVLHALCFGDELFQGFVCGVLVLRICDYVDSDNICEWGFCVFVGGEIDMVYCKKGVIVFVDDITGDIVCVADKLSLYSCEGFVICRANINSIDDFVGLVIVDNVGVLASDGVEYDVGCGLLSDSQFVVLISDVFEKSVSNIVCSFNVVG